MRPKLLLFSGLLLSLMLALAACNTPVQQTATTEPFKPIPPPTRTPEPTRDPIAPTATYDPDNCRPVLRWLSDVTLPDGSIVEAGEVLDKQWEVENSGTCNWEEGYTLRQVDGDKLGSPESMPLVPARAKTTVILRVELKAPQESGRYTAAWQAFNHNDQPFGDQVFVEFVVP